MASVFLEIVIKAADAALVGIDSRDEIEDVVERALAASGFAEVSGGGGGSGVYVLDIDVFAEKRLEATLDVLRRALVEVGVPRSTRIRQRKPVERVFTVYAE